MTDTEYMTEFSIWSLLQSPLVVATDPRLMTPLKKQILYNTEILAVNQDPNGLPGKKIADYDCGTENITCSIWAKVLSDASYAVVLFNKGEESNYIEFDFDLIGWANTTVLIRDLWQHTDIGDFFNSFSAPVEPHGVVMIKVTLEG